MFAWKKDCSGKPDPRDEGNALIIEIYYSKD